jgi:hypothetical protein
MKNTLIIIILLSVLLAASSAPCWQPFISMGGQRAGTSSAQFLKIGVGARAAGLGDAFVAVADDASALYWNPAGLALLPSNQVHFTHIQWPAEIEYEFVGLTKNLDPLGAVGLSIASLHMDDMAVTTEYQPHGTGEYFSYGDFLGAVTYARRLTDRFSFGISLKYIQEELAELTTRGWVVDMGTYYRTGFKSLRIAANLANFGPNLRPGGSYLGLNEQGQEVTRRYESFAPPTVFRLGTAMDFLENDSQKLTVCFAMNHPVDNAENASLGLEYKFLKVLSARLGYKFNYDEERFTVGGGLELPLLWASNMRVDYAYTDFGLLQSAHRFSFDLWF